eukprot:gene7581-15541_t
MGCSHSSRGNKAEVLIGSPDDRIRKNIDKLKQLCKTRQERSKAGYVQYNEGDLLQVELAARGAMFDVLFVCRKIKRLAPELFFQFKNSLDDFCVFFPTIAAKISIIATTCLNTLRSKTMNEDSIDCVTAADAHNRSLKIVQNDQSTSQKNLYNRRRGQLLKLNPEVDTEAEQDYGFYDLSTPAQCSSKQGDSVKPFWTFETKPGYSVIKTVIYLSSSGRGMLVLGV